MISALLGIINGAIQGVNKVLDMFRDKQLRNEGANDQKLSDTQGVLKNVETANAAPADPALDKRVSDEYGK